MSNLQSYLSERDPMRLSVGVLRLSKRVSDKDEDTPFNTWLKNRRMHFAAHHDRDVMKREKKKFYLFKLKNLLHKESLVIEATSIILFEQQMDKIKEGIKQEKTRFVNAKKEFDMLMSKRQKHLGVERKIKTKIKVTPNSEMLKNMLKKTQTEINEGLLEIRHAKRVMDHRFKSWKEAGTNEFKEVLKGVSKRAESKRVRNDMLRIIKSQYEIFKKTLQTAYKPIIKPILSRV